MTEARLDAEDSGGTLQVALCGEIDMDNVGTVDGELRALISNRHTAVVLDLGNLLHLDSSGLRMLFTLGRRLETLQIGFQLLVPRDSAPRRVIELSGIAEIVSLQPGVESPSS